MGTAAERMIELTRRGQAWARRWPMVVDVIVAVVTGVLALADFYGENLGAAREDDLLGAALVASAAAALVWRRRLPLPVLAAVIALMVPIYVRDYGTFVAPVGLAAVYSAAAHGRNRRVTWFAVVGAVCVLFIAASFGILDNAEGYDTSNAIGMAGSCGSAIVAGGIVRNRHELFVSTANRADHAEATRLAEAERAVSRERLRIAREMHDVVAHSMSVISVQAAAAQQIAHSDPDRAASVMHNVESTAREALDEMRRMLGVLRNTGDAATGLAPQPTLADLEATVVQSIDAGVATTLEVTGSRRNLPPGIELAAYRIVQEALTNVRKHAGQSATAVVTIDYGDAELAVSVVDDGAGHASSLSRTGAGNGLLGMRERIDLYDGDLVAGPRTGGGYAVTARLPLPGSDDVPLRPTTTQEAP